MPRTICQGKNCSSCQDLFVRAGKNWIEWVSEQKGRRSIGELAKTGGTETGWRESSNVIHIQAELCEHDKQGKRKGGGGAGMEE